MTPQKLNFINKIIIVFNSNINKVLNSYFQIGMTKHTFLPTSNVEASQKEYLIASKFILSFSNFE